MEEEEGCAFYDLICHGKSLVASGVESVAGGALEAVTGAMMAGAEAVLNALGTFWLRQDFVDLPTNSDVAWLQSSLAPFVSVAVVVSVLVGAGQVIWNQRGAPLKELGKSLATVIVVSGTGLIALGLLIDVGNDFSVWIIESSGEEGFSSLAGGMLNNPSAGMGFMLLGAIVALVVGAIQIMLLFVRSAMLLLLASVLPLATSATNTAWGKEWAKKLLGWTIAFILFKPAAAIVIALGLNMLADEEHTPFEDLMNAEVGRLGCDAGSQECQREALGNVMGGAIDVGSDGSLTRFLMGLVILIASVITLPALMRFIVPATSSIGSGGGGLGSALGGAAVAATGVMASGAVSAKFGSGQASASSSGPPSSSGVAGGGLSPGATGSSESRGSGSGGSGAGGEKPWLNGPGESGGSASDGQSGSRRGAPGAVASESGDLSSTGGASGGATTGSGSANTQAGQSTVPVEAASGSGTTGRHADAGGAASRHAGAGVAAGGAVGGPGVAGAMAAARGASQAVKGVAEDAVGDGRE